MTQLANYNTENFRSISMSNLVTMPLFGDSDLKLPISYTLVIKDQDENTRKLKLFQKYKSLEDVRKVDFREYVKEKLNDENLKCEEGSSSRGSKSCIHYDETLLDDTFIRDSRTPQNLDYDITHPSLFNIKSSSPIPADVDRVLISPQVSTIIEESEYSSKTKDSRSPSECTLPARDSYDELDCIASVANHQLLSGILWDESFNLTSLNLSNGCSSVSKIYKEKNENKIEGPKGADIKINLEDKEGINVQANDSPFRDLPQETVIEHPINEQNPNFENGKIFSENNAIGATKITQSHNRESTPIKRTISKISSAQTNKKVDHKAVSCNTTTKVKAKESSENNASIIKKQSISIDKVRNGVMLQDMAQNLAKTKSMKESKSRNISLSSRTRSKSSSLNSRLTKSQGMLLKSERPKSTTKTNSNQKLSQKAKSIPRSQSSCNDVMKKKLEAKIQQMSPSKLRITPLKNEPISKIPKPKVEDHHSNVKEAYLYHPKEPPVKSIKECLYLDYENSIFSRGPNLSENQNQSQMSKEVTEARSHIGDPNNIKFSASSIISDEVLYKTSGPSNELTNGHSDNNYKAIKEKISKDHIIELIRRMSNNVVKRPTEYLMSFYKPTPTTCATILTDTCDKPADEKLAKDSTTDTKTTGQNKEQTDTHNMSEYKVSFDGHRHKVNPIADRKLFEFIRRKLKVDHIKAQWEGSTIESEHVDDSRNLLEEVNGGGNSPINEYYNEVHEIGTNFCSLHIPCFPERRSLKYNRAPSRFNGQSGAYKRIKEKLCKDHLMSPTRIIASNQGQSWNLKTEYQKSYGVISDCTSLPKVSRALYLQNREKALLDHIKILNYCDTDIGSRRVNGALENISSKSKSENNISEYRSSFMSSGNFTKGKVPSSAMLFP